MVKALLHQRAISLRQSGIGIKTIARELNISSSTASIWCRNIKLSEKQKMSLFEQAHDPFYGRRKENILKQKEKCQKIIEKYKLQGINEVGSLSERELLIAGIALYWAEGFKKDKRLGFANSDPTMIRLFLKWLVHSCNVPKKHIRLRVGLNISHKHRIHEVEKYWSNITEIPITQFQKPFFQKFVWKKVFPSPESYFGVLRIRANKQLPLFRKIHGWIEGLKNNA